MPSISVILPTDNRRRWLGEAVRSVLSQRYADLELFVIDDGPPTDRSRRCQTTRA
ncbi:MAG: hypothetical protein DMF89_00145 [Acidobacteria bacterium]|nr:MAG: hypothetical protein DMF90_03545 [Acidobacteriota bacterium]PYR53113.1 MAG: hypothetical protein DMF89_00145 [Acidobacteriota bacterium]